MGSPARRALDDVGVHLGEERPEGVRVALDVAAGIADRAGDRFGRPATGRAAGSRWAGPGGRSRAGRGPRRTTTGPTRRRRPRSKRCSSVPPRPGRSPPPPGAVLEAEHDAGGVVGGHLSSIRSPALARSRPAKVSTGPGRVTPHRDEGVEVGHHLDHPRPVMKRARSSQCEPMSATDRRSPACSGSRRQFQSVSSSSQSWR